MVVFLGASRLNGQSIFDSMDVLTEYGSQRSKALGYATVALDGYTGSARMNPATIGRRNTFQVSSYFMNNLHSWFSRNYDSYHKLYQPYADVRFNRGALAAYVTYLDLGNRVFSDPNGVVLGRGHSFQYSAGLAAAYQFTPVFTGGFGFRYITDEPGMDALKSGYHLNTAHALSFDFGINYMKTYDFNSFLIRTSAGWSLTNFGTLMHYNETETNPLPMIMQGGFGFRFVPKDKIKHRTVVELGLYVSASHLLARKNSDGRAFGPFEALVKGWSPYYQDYTDNYVSFLGQFDFHFGMEISFWGKVNLRGGYIVRPSVLGFNDVTSAGIGLDLNYAVLDFTYAFGEKSNTYKSNVSTVFQLTLRVPFHSSDSK